jgi:hypothetical protein
MMRAREFTWRRTAEGWRDVLQQVLEGRRPLVTRGESH